MTPSLASFVAFGFFALSLLGAGLACLGVFRICLAQPPVEGPTRGEALLLALTFGVSIATFLGLALAYVGQFSLAGAGAVLLFLSAAWVRAAQRGWRLLVGSRWVALDVIGFVVAACFLCYGVIQRSHEIQALRDEGVYTATGI